MSSVGEDNDWRSRVAYSAWSCRPWWITHKYIFYLLQSEVCSPEDQVLEEDEEEEVGACPVCSRVGFTAQGDLAAHIDTHFSRTPSIGKSRSKIIVSLWKKIKNLFLALKMFFEWDGYKTLLWWWFSLLVVTPDEGGWERRLVTELEKQEKEVQRMREQQEFSLLRVNWCCTTEIELQWRKFVKLR